MDFVKLAQRFDQLSLFHHIYGSLRQERHKFDFSRGGILICTKPNFIHLLTCVLPNYSITALEQTFPFQTQI